MMVAVAARPIARLDLEAGAILGDVRIALFGSHLADQHERALDCVTLDVIERPHIALVEAQMRLSRDRLSVRTHKA